MSRLLVLGILLAAAATASAATIIQDDFESYADTTALNAVWPAGVGTATTTYLEVGANGPTWPGEKCVRHTLAAARRDRNFTDTPVTGSGYLVWQFDYYDFVGNASDPRQYAQILAKDPNGALAQLISLGQYNAATSQNSNKYQARVAFGGPNWFNLNTDRSVGWHTFKAVIYATTVDFYVDGVLDTAGVAHTNGTWYQARIGSGSSSAGGEARYDNYLVEYVPEPAAFGLFVLGLGLLRRR